MRSTNLSRIKAIRLASTSVRLLCLHRRRGSPAREAANRHHDCAVVAMINSIQDYWSAQFARSGKTYRKATTNFFNGGVRTGCGSATSDTGPFYCPADSKVYIDLSFFSELRTRFGAQG